MTRRAVQAKGTGDGRADEEVSWWRENLKPFGPTIEAANYVGNA
jgi:hypothetical protein